MAVQISSYSAAGAYFVAQNRAGRAKILAKRALCRRSQCHPAALAPPASSLSKHTSPQVGRRGSSSNSNNFARVPLPPASGAGRREIHLAPARLSARSPVRVIFAHSNKHNAAEA